MSPERRRQSVAEIRAKQQGARETRDKDGRRRVQQLGGDLTPMQAAGAGKESKFTTYISKAKRLQLVMRCSRTHVVNGQVTFEAGHIIRFENQIYTAKSQEEEEFLANHKELGKRFFTKKRFVEMSLADEARLVEEHRKHKELLKREMAGETEFKGDRELLEGLRPEPDKLPGDHRPQEVEIDDGDAP
jgi:hypothetical protein